MRSETFDDMNDTARRRTYRCVKQKLVLQLLLGLLLVAVVGCRPPVKVVDLPPPIQMTSIGVGDVFIMEIVGEEKLPKEFTVAPDGSVDFPYIHRVTVAGLEPQEITARVREKLMAGKFLTDPSVSVSVKEYKSKRISVTGEVKKSRSIPLEPGMTLVRAISEAGGLTPMARQHGLILRRKIGKGTKAVVVDYEAITNNKIPDVPLQAGDTIHVPQRVF